MKRLSPRYKLILLSSRLKLRKVEIEDFAQQLSMINDWESLVPHIIARQAGPLLYKKLNQYPDLRAKLPDTAITQLKQSWLKTLSRSMVLEQHFKEVATAFASLGIDLIAMKGIYLSEHLYSESGLRQYSDIDILVRESDGDRAMALLTEMGYHSKTLYLSEFYEKHKDKRRPVHFPPMLKNGVSIEVHCRLYDDDSPYKVDIESLWEKSVNITLYGVGVKVFCPEHLLINLCLHLDKHFQGGEYQFTGFYDIANLLDGRGMPINYPLLMLTAQEWKVWLIIQRHFLLCERYFNVTLPADLPTMTYVLSKADILLFEERLEGAGSKLNFFARHGSELAQFKKPGQKFMFLWHYFFPSRQFIRMRYRPANSFELILYYPYRLFVAIKISLNALIGWILSR